MGLDQYAHLRNRKVDWKKFYSDNEEESQTEQKGVFVWRKHARLQVFMNEQWRKQNSHKVKEQQRKAEKDIKSKKSTFMDFDLSHLGFNAGEKVYMTEEVCDNLEKAISSNYAEYFASDGFFWGQQFQEHSVKEYEEQDLAFLNFCRQAIKDKKVVEYECSW